MRFELKPVRAVMLLVLVFAACTFIIDVLNPTTPVPLVLAGMDHGLILFWFLSLLTFSVCLVALPFLVASKFKPNNSLLPAPDLLPLNCVQLR
jgi:hypothetical protein